MHPSVMTNQSCVIAITRLENLKLDQGHTNLSLYHTARRLFIKSQHEKKSACAGSVSRQFVTPDTPMNGIIWVSRVIAERGVSSDPSKRVTQ